MTFRLLATLLCASALAGQAVAGAVTLRPEPAAGERVTLGDLFEGAGRASGVVVAPGPQPGGTVVLDAQAVQRLARAHGVEWDNAQGLRRLVVRSGGPAPAAGAVPASAARVEVLTYARSLAAGEIVRAEDLVYAPVQAHLAPADAPRDPDAAVGQALRRPVRAGAAVAGRDLTAPVVIRRDELITVTWREDGVSLSLQARALQPAAVGQSFSAVNPQSKKTIEVVATGPGRAVAGPEAERLRTQSFASR